MYGYVCIINSCDDLMNYYGDLKNGYFITKEDSKKKIKNSFVFRLYLKKKP